MPVPYVLIGLYGVAALYGILMLSGLDRLARGKRIGPIQRSSLYLAALLATGVGFLLPFQVAWGWVAIVASIILLMAFHVGMLRFMRPFPFILFLAIFVGIPLAGGWAALAHLYERRDAGRSILVQALQDLDTDLANQTHDTQALAKEGISACTARGNSFCFEVSPSWTLIRSEPPENLPVGLAVTSASPDLKDGFASGIGTIAGSGPYRLAASATANGHLVTVRPLDATYLQKLAGSGKPLALGTAGGTLFSAGPAATSSLFHAQSVANLVANQPEASRYLRTGDRYGYYLVSTRRGAYTFATVVSLAP